MLPVKIDKGRYRKFGFKLDNGKTHIGHDFDCPENTEVFAVADGIVISFEQVNGFGSMYPHTPGGVLIIEHNNNIGEKFFALYGHVESFVSVDDEIKKGQKIGRILSFYNKGIFLPHLHFCVYNDVNIPSKPFGYTKNIRKWVNPLEYLEKFC